MKTIKSKIIISISIILAINLLFGVFAMFNISNSSDELSLKSSAEMDLILNASTIHRLSETIRYEDEVLTQSARNYAYTGNIIWKERYNQNSPLLDSAINEALVKSNDEEKILMNNINNANQNLVIMENQSMIFVDSGNRLQAQSILESSDYSSQKTIYNSYLVQYFAVIEKKVNNNTMQSFSNLDTINKKIVSSSILNASLVGILITFSIIISIIIFILINKFLLKSILYLNKMTDKITAGNYDQNIIVKSNDEIGALTTSIKKMMVKIKLSTENIESKVDRRTKELEKINALMIGRELKMIELKKTIIELEKKHNNHNNSNRSDTK